MRRVDVFFAFLLTIPVAAFGASAKALATYLDLPDGARPSALAADSVGNLFVASNVNEPSGRQQIRVIKTDPHGLTLASMDFGGSVSDAINGAAVDSNGNLGAAAVCWAKSDQRHCPRRSGGARQNCVAGCHTHGNDRWDNDVGPAVAARGVPENSESKHILRCGRGRCKRERNAKLGANPAAPGSVVTVWATGFGNVALSVSVLVWQGYPGNSLDVLYAGQAPGMVDGVVQVNFRLPAEGTSISGLAFQLQVGDALSDVSLISMKQ